MRVLLQGNLGVGWGWELKGQSGHSLQMRGVGGVSKRSTGGGGGCIPVSGAWLSSCCNRRLPIGMITAAQCTLLKAEWIRSLIKRY